MRNRAAPPQIRPATDLYGIELVVTDASVLLFLLSGIGVKASCYARHKRHGKRPLPISHHEVGAIPVLGFDRHTHLLSCSGRQSCSARCRSRGNLSGEEQCRLHAAQRSRSTLFPLKFAAYCIDQRLGGILRRTETSWTRHLPPAAVLPLFASRRLSCKQDRRTHARENRCPHRPARAPESIPSASRDLISVLL